VGGDENSKRSKEDWFPEATSGSNEWLGDDGAKAGERLVQRRMEFERCERTEFSLEEEKTLVDPEGVESRVMLTVVESMRVSRDERL
jgi:hypothetical protein